MAESHMSENTPFAAFSSTLLSFYSDVFKFTFHATNMIGISEQLIDT